MVYLWTVFWDIIWFCDDTGFKGSQQAWEHRVLWYYIWYHRSYGIREVPKTVKSFVSYVLKASYYIHYYIRNQHESQNSDNANCYAMWVLWYYIWYMTLHIAFVISSTFRDWVIPGRVSITASTADFLPCPVGPCRRRLVNFDNLRMLCWFHWQQLYVV